MEETRKLSKFAKYAWLVLAYNIVVILWGVFLRASKSGDGCGQHWLTCHGEVIPSAPELKTIIEFSHRLTSGLAFITVLILLVWALRKYQKGSPVRKAAVVSFIFIITEALVGAGLVLTGNTAESLTAARPFWAIGHLINTFILLAFLSLTAWYAGKDCRSIDFQRDPKTKLLLGIAVFAVVLVAVSGSIAALGSMLYPSATLTEGIASDFSADSNMLVRLRLFHPFLSVLSSVYLIFLAGWIKAQSIGRFWTTRWANVLSITLLVQLAFGSLTLLTLAPILMQVGHLFLADMAWISFVLMSANYFEESRSELTSV
jgi:heme A synthase